MDIDCHSPDCVDYNKCICLACSFGYLEDISDIWAKFCPYGNPDFSLQFRDYFLNKLRIGTHFGTNTNNMGAGQVELQCACPVFLHFPANISEFLRCSAKYASNNRFARFPCNPHLIAKIIYPRVWKPNCIEEAMGNFSYNGRPVSSPLAAAY